MRTETLAKPKSAQRSLTDWILTLCASGRFGIREAIAVATRRNRKTQEPPEQQSDQQQTE